MSEITKLEPKLVWELFDAITRVPRPSKKEEKIRSSSWISQKNTTSTIRPTKRVMS